MIDLIKGDCLEIMKSIPDGSIDAIITDPPYGTTACKWDSVIPFDLMWEQLNRIIKPNGAIVLFGSEPFSSALRMSNINGYCYDWIYDKKFGGNFVQAKRQPIKTHENISVFSIIGKMPIYSPQMIKRDVPKEHKSYDVKFPDSQLHYSCRTDRGLHPTQKPVELMEYLIKTYTNENETVLDFTMGSGSTGVACKNTNRKFIGIEMDEKYFEIAMERINNHVAQQKLF